MHPTLVTLGSVSLPSYGVCLVIGFLACTALTLWLGRRAGVAPLAIIDLAFATLLGGWTAAGRPHTRSGYCGVHYTKLTSERAP